MRALDRKLLRDLAHLRSQLAAIALVVTAGVSLFIMLRSMHWYLRDSQQAYYRDYRFADVFVHCKQAPRSLLGELVELPGAGAVEARIVYDVLLDVPGVSEPATGRLISLPPAGRPQLLNLPHLRRGRLPVEQEAGEVMISEAFAEANRLELGASLIAILSGRRQRLTVVGVALSPEYVYEIRGAGDIFPDNRRFGVLWMNERPLATALDLEGSWNDLVLALAPGASEADVIAGIDRVLEPYGGLGAYGRDDQISHRFLSDEIAETQVTSLLIPAMFLGVTAFLLHLVTARLVAMQRTEIGVLKAFGYGNGAVALHFSQLAAVPVAAGAGVGTVLGLWLARRMALIYADFFRFPVLGWQPRPAIVALALLVSGGAALIGAGAAVRTVLRLPAAEAMRAPAPARYRRGALERSGALRKLSPAARMIVRTLARQPLRAAMSVLGIALAVGMVVSGRFIFDAIEYLKDLQFREVQRDDAMVVFEQPRAPAALAELAHEPGVLYAEPFRSAATRLVRGHRTKRVALLGLATGGSLRRIVDSSGQAHRVPADGILLTDRLAEALDVLPGDEVEIELLEGRRRRQSIVVREIADEAVGLQAYLDLALLDQVAGEGRAISGAFLSVDPQLASQLYRRIKATPAVGGVAIREAARQGFERTIEENFRLSLLILVLFACVIAFGMLYNTARIALSERGRELASLRVLGFDRREVAAMLLGEQAVLVALALPAGSAIGYGLCALIALRADTDLFRLPLVLSGFTYAFAVVVVIGAAAISAIAVRRRLDRADLVAVLKSRE